jgi:hypothetical protein
VAVRSLYQRSENEPILAATSSGLFESDDAETWRPLLLDDSGGGHYAITSTLNSGDGRGAGHQLVAASATGMSISHDRGRTWSVVRLDGGKQLRIRNVAASPVDPSQLLAATEAGLMRSSDGGTTWQNHARGIPAGAVADVAFDRDDPKEVLVAGSIGAFYSQDGGDWYTRLGPSSVSDYSSFELSSVLVLPNNQAVAVSVNNGLFIQDGREGFLVQQSPAKSK